jgi:hypothetical protein
VLLRKSTHKNRKTKEFLFLYYALVIWSVLAGGNFSNLVGFGADILVIWSVLVRFFVFNMLKINVLQLKKHVRTRYSAKTF